MDQNPFLPPNAAVADRSTGEGHPPKPLLALVLVLFALHALVTWRYFDFFFQEVRTGGIHPLGPLAGLLADALLFVGVVLLCCKRYAPTTLLIACAGFLVAIYLLLSSSFPYLFVLLTYGFGVAAASVGWWAASHYRQQQQAR